MSSNASGQKGNDKDREAFTTLMVVISIGLVGIIIYALCSDPRGARGSNLSIGFLVAGATLCFGGFFGFLFGMPRAAARTNVTDSQTSAEDRKGSRSQSTSNIEPNT